jgi:hypothetical protein
MKAKNTLLILLILFSSAITAQVSYVENNNLKYNSLTSCQIRYIYFPNLTAYYDMLNNNYIFQEKGQWITAKELPTLYGGYSLYSNIGVEIKDYDEDKPFTQIKQHKRQYPYCSNGHFSYKTVAIN